MEQPALLNIIRTDTHYQFRLDLPDGQADQEYITDLTVEIRERLRRAMQSALQSMQMMAMTDVKRQTVKLSAVNDALLTLGRFLFESVLPVPLQDLLRRLDIPLIISTNTPEVPWELMFDNITKPGRFLCQSISVGRLVQGGRDSASYNTLSDRAMRKLSKRDVQGLSILFLVNPTGERPSAEEEVVALCTSLPETIGRSILYRQQ